MLDVTVIPRAQLTTAETADVVSDLAEAYGPDTVARVTALAELTDGDFRRHQAASAALDRRADLTLYVDLLAERYPDARTRPRLRDVIAADELYATLVLLAVA